MLAAPARASTRGGTTQAGRATPGTDVDVRRRAWLFNSRRDDPRIIRFGVSSRRGPVSVPTSTFRVRARYEFFVFEPQVELATRATDYVSVSWATGYRLTALTEALDDRLNSTTGSVALQPER